MVKSQSSCNMSMCNEISMTSVQLSISVRIVNISTGIYMIIMTFDAVASEFSAVWAPGGLQLKTDIDSQNFAVSVFKPSLVGGNLVLVED